MAEQSHPIHFRFTYKDDPWKLLMDAPDGRDSINVSVEEHKGMSLKDSDKIAIPSFVYKDLWNDAYLSTPGTGTFLVAADNTSDSLRLVDFSAIDIEEINALLECLYIHSIFHSTYILFLNSACFCHQLDLL